MKRKLFLLLLIISFGNQLISANEYSTTRDVISIMKGKPKAAKLQNKRAAYCLPNPSEKYFELKEAEELYDYYADKNDGLTYDDIYFYLLFSIDTVKAKHMKKVAPNGYVLEWEQEFTEGITFQKNQYEESGSGGALYTKCKDHSAFFNTIEPVIRFIPFENWYDYNPVWNEDSTTYSPADEGAGCYYEIKNDSLGFLMMSWYCGC